MPTQDTVLAALAPIAAAVADTDLTDADAAEAHLCTRVPPASLGELRALLLAARDEGWLAPKQATPTLSFGRLAKPSEATSGMSIDVVDMEGVGAEHGHPRGEASLCFATAGNPRFDGKPEGWVVKAAGSHHAPTVTGGRMLIVYFLPDGAMRWGPRDA